MSSAPLRALRRVRVGSTNPPKLAGVRAALADLAPLAEVAAVEVESGVAEQPIGFEEIACGARQRAEAAAASGACDMAVGYEDGLVELPLSTGVELPLSAPRGWFNVGCAAVCSGEGERVSLGLSSGFAYPPACSEQAVRERAPIGALFDRLWQNDREPVAEEPSALSVGNVGRLTDGALTRADYTRQAVLCALAAWLHPELYASAGDPA